MQHLYTSCSEVLFQNTFVAQGNGGLNDLLRQPCGIPVMVLLALEIVESKTLENGKP